MPSHALTRCIPHVWHTQSARRAAGRILHSQQSELCYGGESHFTQSPLCTYHSPTADKAASIEAARTRGAKEAPPETLASCVARVLRVYDVRSVRTLRKQKGGEADVALNRTPIKLRKRWVFSVTPNGSDEHVAYLYVEGISVLVQKQWLPATALCSAPAIVPEGGRNLQLSILYASGSVVRIPMQRKPCSNLPSAAM